MAALLFAWWHVLVPWRLLAASGSDFANYHRAAHALLAGSSPYTVHAFDYPPLLAFLLAPLAPLSLAVAREAWFWLGEACLIAAAALTWGSLRGRLGGWPAAALVATLWAVSGAIVEVQALGQVTPLLLLLLAAALRLEGARPAAAAAAIGGAAALKLWPALLLVAFLWRRQWRALAAGLATLLALVVVPLLWIRLTAPPPHLPTSAGYWMGTPAPLGISLPALALRLADLPLPTGPLPYSWRLGHDPAALVLPPGRAALSLAVAGAVLALGLGAIAWARRRGGGTAALETAALILLAVLASPIAWYHYQLVLLLPAAVAAGRLLEPGGGRRRGSGAATALLGVAAALAVATRLHQGLFGAYVARFGWTSEAPGALLVATSLVPWLNAAAFAALVALLARGHPGTAAGGGP